MSDRPLSYEAVADVLDSYPIHDVISGLQYALHVRYRWPLVLEDGDEDPVIEALWSTLTAELNHVENAAGRFIEAVENSE